jgi:outer membrane protein TolC
MPLDSEAVGKALAPPNMEAIRVQAKTLQHPLLRPIEFDERDGLSPDEAAILAVLANPSLRAVRDQRGIASAQVLQAGLLPNPALSSGGEFPLRAPGEVNSYALDAAWDISGLITRGAKRDAAKAQAASVELDVAWQEWQVAEGAKTAVYRVIGLEAQLTGAEQVEQRLRDNLKIVKEAVDQHLKTAVDQAAAEAALQEAHATVLDLRQDLRKERLALARSLGQPPGAEVRIQKDTLLPSRLALPAADEFLKGLEDRRLDLVALRRGYESQEATVRAAILAQFPKVEVGIHHTRDSGNFFTLGPTLAFDVPIFDRNQGNIAIEKATRRKLFDEYVNRLFEARSEIATLLAEIESTADKLASAEGAVPILEELVRVYEDALAAGNADILSFYGAQNDLAKKTIEILKLKQELVELRIGLELASGRYLEEPARAPAAPAAPRETQPKEGRP